MSTLADFLLARIAEDDAAARARIGHQDQVYEAAGWWDCDRVLAECEAKRRIIERHQNWPVLVEQPLVMDNPITGDSIEGMTMRMSRQIMWATEREYRMKFGTEPPTSPILRLLAMPYADHPDFRSEWRVDVG